MTRMTTRVTCECGETCERTADDWVIGYDQYAGTYRWYVVRENGQNLTQHMTHNDAMRWAQNKDPHVQMFHEANGGGCLGSFEESPYSDDDEGY